MNAAELAGSERLASQLRFLLEIDRLKTVLRQNPVGDRSRRENSAEHSWHLALLALVLAEHSAEPIEIAKVVQMVLVHDIVEVDAGDVFVYDDAARESKAEAELRAAERIFGLLPPDQGDAMRALWDEFERGDTPEARFAHALDRLQPLMLNHATGGEPWQRHGIAATRVRERNALIEAGAPALWPLVATLIDDAVERGFLAE